MSRFVRIGKRYAIYLPKAIVRELKLREGDRLIVECTEDRIILRLLPRLLRERKYWSETTVEEFERESEALIEAGEED